MSVIVHNQHRSAERRDGASLGAVHARHTRADHGQCGRARVCPVGATSRISSRLFIAPRKAPERTSLSGHQLGGAFIVPRPSHSWFAHPVHPRSCGGRRLGFNLLGRGARQFMRTLLAVRSHSHFRIGNKLGGYRADLLEAHRLSQSVGFNTTEPKRGHLEPCSLNRGKRLPQ